MEVIHPTALTLTPSLCGLTLPPPLCLSLALSPSFTIYPSHQPPGHSPNTSTSFPLTCLDSWGHSHTLRTGVYFCTSILSQYPMFFLRYQHHAPSARMGLEGFSATFQQNLCITLPQQKKKSSPRDLFLSYSRLKIWKSTVCVCTMGLSLDKLTRFRSLIFS